MEDQIDEKKEEKLKALRKKYGRFGQPKKNLLIHLENTMGNISLSCQKSGSARSMFYVFLEKDADFKQAYDDIREQVVDFYETKLVQAANNGEVAAIIFGLKCQGKHRGWAEKSQVEISGHIEQVVINRKNVNTLNEPIKD